MSKLALVFPGSGSQYVGMGKSLYDNFKVFRDTMNEANEVTGINLSSICFDGSVVKLNKIENMLLSIFAVSVGTYRVYKETIGIEPDFMAGHSLGEYTALCCSGVLSFSDLLQIVKKRSILAKRVAKEKKGIMSVIMDVDPKVIKDYCESLSNENEIVGIACYNSEKQFMVSGSESLVLKVEQRVKSLGGNIIPLIGSAPYHSLLMDYVCDEFEEELKKYNFKRGNCPIISNINALPYDNEKSVLKGLVKQMTSPVLWKESIDYLENIGVDTILEIGPNNVLKTLISESNKGINSLTYSYKKDRDSLKDTLGKYDYISELVSTSKHLLSVTPNYNNEDEGKIEDIYQRLRMMYLLERNELSTNINQIIRITYDILKLKSVSIDEMQDIIQRRKISDRAKDILYKIHFD